MSEANTRIWAFDLGKGSIGKAHDGKEKGAAKAPCGSHRSRLATQAASALLSTIHGQLDWF
jgi:hypothetical protein